MYLKKLWFPMAPPEYSCINRSLPVSINNIIVEFACQIADCVGMKSRYPSRIFHPYKVSCLQDRTSQPSLLSHGEAKVSEETSEDWNGILKVCTDIGGTLAFIILIVIVIVRGRQSISSFVQSFYNRVIV
jgi:hypothetical protein